MSSVGTQADDDDIRARHLRRDDFLGAFAVVRRGGRVLMVQNQRIVHGRRTLTWDLPGGQVEPGELLEEALIRELSEETGLRIEGPHPLLFVQEGARERRGVRDHAWRSFFFAVDVFHGQPRAGHEVLDVRWFERGELDEVLTAPYHDSFRRWLQRGGSWFGSVWAES